jgi:predicted regulator of Ras-like GTPase activity (Roadblock/LC7/MglB family)
MKNKKIVAETSTAFVEDATVKPVEEENFEYTNLNNALVEIRKTPKTTGYILKSQTAATIDLNDPNKLLDYSLLTSKVMDSTQELDKLFDIGKAESILIEGKTTKTLCIIKGENKASVFMEKTADHNEILKKIETTQTVPKIAP